LPIGAVAGPESWAFWDNQFRIFHRADRLVSDPAGDKVAEVQTGGIQFSDGSIDTGECPPSVDVYVYRDEGITADQARALATTLLELAPRSMGGRPDEQLGWRPLHGCPQSD
jgi:hypothetical protein